MLDADFFGTMTKRLTRSLGIAVVATGLLFTSAFAGTIAVTTTTDEFNTGALCSLREAIESANTDTNFGGCTRVDTAPYDVTVPVGTYTLSLAGAGEDVNATGDLDIRASMNIVSVSLNPPVDVIVQAGTDADNGIDRVFHVVADDLAVGLENFTIRYGAAADNGGGLANTSTSTVTVNTALVIDNKAAGSEANEGGGGLFNDLGGTLIISGSQIINNEAITGSGSGGGILNRAGSTLQITDSLIQDNAAARAGGGIEANASTTMLTNVNLIDNETGPTPGNGGGLHLTGAGTITITGGSVISNTAAAEGGGLWNSAAGVMLVDGVEVRGNSAAGINPVQGGGGLFNTGGNLTVINSTISANAATGTAGSGGGILNVMTGTLTVSNTVISNNSSLRAGGGIESNAGSVSLTNVNLVENETGPTPGNGGGLHLTGAGTVTVTGGMVVSNTATAEGGGLWNSAAGVMLMDGVEVRGNSAGGVAADQGGGGLFNDGGNLAVMSSIIASNVATGTAGSGGGVLNVMTGTLTISDSVISNNLATRAGGGIESNFGTVTLTGVNLLQNMTGPTPGNGGGLHLTGAGTVTVTGGMVVSNTATAEGGGLWNSPAGVMLVDGTTIRGNSAAGANPDQGGGGLFNIGGDLMVVNSTISANAATGAAGSGGGILNRDGGTLVVSDTVIADNSSVRAGGGIEDNASTSTLTDVDLVGNATGPTPGNGGGLHSTAASTVNITGGQILSNTAATEGGGLWNSGVGTMTVTQVALAYNRANGTGANNGGGALFNVGGPMHVSNSTVSGNSAANNGGGLKAIEGDTMLTNVTLFDNSGDIGVEAIVVVSGTVTLRNSIIAASGVTGLCRGNITIPEGVPNLATDETCGASLVDSSPNLGPLAENGGDTLTHALLAGSPALDAADDAICAAAPVNNVDQRGVPRPQANGCDLGAYEVGSLIEYLYYFSIIRNDNNDDE